MTVTPARSYDIPGFSHRWPDRPVLKLTFQSAFDLAAYTRDSYGTDVYAEFCDRALRFQDHKGVPAPGLTYPGLYVENGAVIGLKGRLAPDQPAEVDRRQYHAYLFVTRPPWWPYPEQNWDLSANPHDVCVRMDTMKEYLLHRTQSDVMRIPAAVLRAALGPALVR